MTKAEKVSSIALPIVLLIGAGLAWAGSGNSVVIGGLPLYALCIALAFVIQWLVFIPSWLGHTEKFYDITGGITYLSIITVAWLVGGNGDLRSSLAALMVVVWAFRLASFLFIRIHHAGKDDRFDEIKISFPRFLLTWTLQGLWVSFTAAAALAIIASPVKVGIDLTFWIGLLFWLIGFGLEIVADEQKRQFRADPANEGKFIRTGLWAISRHPNYLGEIILWVGMLVLAVPVLSGWGWVALLSPIFVWLLLTRVSGVPMLEAKADKRWGGQAEYEAYKQKTGVLLPMFGKGK